MTRRTVPADLGPDGRALWRKVHAWLQEHRLELDPHERPLVDELARIVDRLAALRGALARLEDPTDSKWIRASTEARLSAVAYGRIVAQVGLPTGAVPDVGSGDKVVGLSPASRRGSKAARARWDRAGQEASS